MEKNIKLNYEMTKDQQRPSRYEQQVGNGGIQNSLDMKKIVENYEFWLGNILQKNQKSQIYHGIDKNNQQPVAIKVIPVQKAFTSRQRQQLQNEIKFCKYLARHKNIIRVHDTFSTSNNYYIMMEKAQGDLKSLLMRKKALGQEEVIGIMLDILEAVKFMHSSGYMHCNIKPSNVLMRQDGAKLTDFALTRKLTQDSKSSFQPNQWTPYMNHLTLVTRTYDENNDVWALAVMVYECLHGYHNYPWKFETYSDLLQKIYDLNIQYNRKVSKEMAEFLTKILNPSNKLSVLDLYNEPFVKNSIQKRKEKYAQGIEELNRNGFSPKKYPSQKFGNFSADIANQIVNRAQTRSNNQQLIPDSKLPPFRKHTSNHEISSSPRKFITQRVPQTRHIHPRQIIDCQMSFMRFLNIILKQDEHGYIPEKLNPKNSDPKYLEMFEKKDIDHKLFRFVIIKQTLGQKNCLNKTIDFYHPENPFNIRGLEEFMATQQGKELTRNLKVRLKQYDEKYQSLEKEMYELIDELAQRLSKTKPQWRSRDILTPDLPRKQIIPILGLRLSRQLCKHIWSEINTGYVLLSDPKSQSNEPFKTQILSQMEEKVRRVDFLMTYYILNCLLIDNFTEPEYFVKQSGLHIIMNNKPMKMELEHFSLVEEKLRTLEII